MTAWRARNFWSKYGESLTCYLGIGMNFMCHIGSQLGALSTVRKYHVRLSKYSPFRVLQDTLTVQIPLIHCIWRARSGSRFAAWWEFHAKTTATERKMRTWLFYHTAHSHKQITPRPTFLGIVQTTTEWYRRLQMALAMVDSSMWDPVSML